MNNALQNAVQGSALGNPNIYSGTYASQGVAQQRELFDEREFMISVHKCKNGHLIRISRNHGEIADMWVVPDGKDVTKAIAAAIVAKKLEK